MIELLTVLGIISILMGLLISAVQFARESARRMECQNHLKQVGLAMQLHEGVHRRLPTGGWGFRWVGDPSRGTARQQPGGWVFNVLPFMEQNPVHAMAEGIQDDATRMSRLAEMIQIPLPVLACPSRRAAIPYPTQWQPFNAEYTAMAAKTDYAANAGDVFVDVGSGPISYTQGDSTTYSWPAVDGTGVCFLRSEISLSDVSDGTSSTYLAGEKNLPRGYYRFGNHRGDDQSMYSGDDFDTLRWACTGWTPLQDTTGTTEEGRFGSAHPGGFNMVLCDGSCRTFDYAIDGEIHRRLGNRHDSLPVTW